jgi:hypothetical protein
MMQKDDVEVFDGQAVLHWVCPKEPTARKTPDPPCSIKTKIAHPNAKEFM